jgi:flagellar basal-body rod modification protein FlgD
MSASAIQPNTASNAAAAPAATAPKTPAADSNQNGLASQSVFLQLLVAQLKNQDPSNPADGTQFVTQLAQFTTLEQTTQSRADLDQILKAMQATAVAQPAATGSAHAATPAPASS